MVGGRWEVSDARQAVCDGARAMGGEGWERWEAGERW